MKRIAIGCDHVGFILKDDILAHLRQRGIDVVDNVPTIRAMPAPSLRPLPPARSTAGS